jgi:hypothetical protein
VVFRDLFRDRFIGRASFWLGTLVVAALLLLLYESHNQAIAGLPADKVAAAGSKVQEAGPGEDITLLSKEIRSSSPADLILQVTAECSIVTNVSTVGNDDQSAMGNVNVWVEVDGERVPISSTDNGADAGEVTFCNRAYRRQTLNFQNTDATINTFESTKDANAFNWMKLNVGSGTHTVEVKATLTETVSSAKAEAEAVVGNRTLIVEPTHLPPDATTDSTP